MSNKMRNLGDPELIADEKDGRMVVTEHGKTALRDDFAKDFSDSILSLLKKRGEIGLTISGASITAQPDIRAMGGSLHFFGVWYKIEFDVSMLASDGTFQDTKKYVVAG